MKSGDRVHGEAVITQDFFFLILSFKRCKRSQSSRCRFFFAFLKIVNENYSTLIPHNWCRYLVCMWNCHCLLSLSVYCFDCFFVSGVKQCFMQVMNRSKNSPSSLWNFRERSRGWFCLIVDNRGLHSVHVFKKFYSICDLKFLSCLLARAVEVDEYSIPFYRFSSQFLAWSLRLVDHCGDQRSRFS